MIKFKNESDEFEYQVLGLDESKFVKKILLAKKFEKIEVENFDKEKLKNGLNKWKLSTHKKRFKKKILESLNTLKEKDVLNYSEMISVLTALNSIKTHLLIELQYFEADYRNIAEFLKMFELFLKYSEIIEKEMLNNLYKQDEIKSKEIIIELFEFFSE